MEEIVWKKIKGFERYSVSNTAVVRNDKTGRLLAQPLNNGYHIVNLYKGQGVRLKMRVHRLVACAFIPLVEGKECIDHINEIKNGNRIVNLRWCTSKENLQFYYETRPAQPRKPYQRETEEHKQKRLSEQSDIMAEKIGQKVFVNRIEFAAVRQAARYIVEEESVLGYTRNADTVRKEIRKLVKGIRPEWSMYGRYYIETIRDVGECVV